MLVMVPQGCDEARTSKLISSWVEANFFMPATFSGHRPFCIDLVSDGIESSTHFAHAIAKRIAGKVNSKIEIDKDDFPTDILQNAIEAALAVGVYPILMIQRFHAFANIRDGGMTSILSRLRSLESDTQLTTLAFSPISYEAIRKMMDLEQPFLNSVYGDMHDEVVMPPLTRKDFLQEAKARDIDTQTAHKLFALGGGPDVVFMTLLDLHKVERNALIGQTADRAGPAIDRFLNRIIPPSMEAKQLLVNLALGLLTPAQEAFLTNLSLHPFLCKKGKDGNYICSSPIISQRILCQNTQILSEYHSCMQYFAVGDYTSAARCTTSLVSPHPHLIAFRELIRLRCSLMLDPREGLLGVDWHTVADATKKLKSVDGDLLAPFRKWLDVIEKTVTLVFPNGLHKRLQTDDFTRRATDPQVRQLVLFMLTNAMRSIEKMNPTASEKVRLLVNVPEAILQSIAAGFCQIDFTKPPATPPVADYDSYFSTKEKFAFPSPKDKLAMRSLLVIVPAILFQLKINGASKLIDPNHTKPLQKKLVDTVRNTASHTIAEFLEKDGEFLENLCHTWVHEWCHMENIASANDFPINKLAPQVEHLYCLLFGDTLGKEIPPYEASQANEYS